MTEVVIADVGHGNCVLVISDNQVLLIDAGSGGTVVELLESYGLTRIERVLLSHGDEDHIGGLLTLLMNTTVRVLLVYLNADASKDSDVWHALRLAVSDARGRGTDVQLGLTSTTDIGWGAQELAVEILAPTPELAMAGPGGEDIAGRPISSNAMSVVIRLIHRGIPLVLLPGDIDLVGLDNLLRVVPSPRARLLVFPHHGGVPAGGEPARFAQRLTDAVRPRAVVFSLGRGRYGTPRPEIVAGLRASAPDVYIVCTQLSERCAAELPAEEPTHLQDKPAQGRRRKACCGGTLVLALDEDTVLARVVRDVHSRFVDANAPSALCRTRPVQPMLWIESRVEG